MKHSFDGYDHLAKKELHINFNTVAAAELLPRNKITVHTDFLYWDKKYFVRIYMNSGEICIMSAKDIKAQYKAFRVFVENWYNSG